MKRPKTTVAPILACLAVGLIAATPAIGGTGACGSEWQVVATPALPNDAQLRDVTVIAPDDAWAVGFKGNFSNTLATHWDGSTWTEVATPNPSAFNNDLAAVAAVSSNDVWAAGAMKVPPPGSPFAVQTPLILHWDGSSWEQESLPTAFGCIFAIEVVGPDDIWFGGDGFLMLHWDGSGFALSFPPITPSGSGRSIQAISAFSANDIWAVGGGAFGDETCCSQIIHWDGNDWTHVPGPAPLGTSQQLNGVVALAPDDVWAVGQITSFPSSHLMLHWDGTAWTRISTPLFSQPQVSFQDMLAFAPDDIWTVGIYTEMPAPAPGLPLTLHYDGSDWTQQLLAPGTPSSAWLRGLAASGPCDFWSVGTTGFNPYVQRLEPARTFCQTDIGFGGPGSSHLSVCGKPLATGGTADVRLDGAPPNTQGLIVASTSLDPVPFKGGSLVPIPIQVSAFFTTNAGGEFTVPGLAGGQGPLTLYLQAVVVDPSLPQQVGVSNAVALAFLP